MGGTPPSEGGEEATYASSTNSNQPTNYISLRVRVEHKFASAIWDKVFADLDWYIYSMHKPGTANEHIHMLVPGDTEKETEKYRKRMRDALKLVPGYEYKPRTNQIYASVFKKGIAAGIQYLGHEGSPIVGSNEMTEEWIKAAPKWVSSKPTEGCSGVGAYFRTKPTREINPDHFKLITYRNLEKVTFRYHKENGITSINLEDTLEHMHKNGWRLDISIIRGGIPSTFYDEFHAKLKDGSTRWTSSRFALMRTVPGWSTN